MSEYRSSNPSMRDDVWSQGRDVASSSDVMSVAGVVNKTAMLVGFLLLGAVWVWHLFFTNGGGTPGMMGQAAQTVMPWMLGGIIGGLIVGFVTIFKPMWAWLTAPIYAVLEGLALGGISAFAQARVPDHLIVVQAVALTMAVLVGMLILYRAGLVRATARFRTGLLCAAGALILTYVATLILGLFGITIPYIHEGGPIGIIFSLVAVTIASLFFVLDFDFVEQGVAQGAPKTLEWYAGFSLLMTLVWVYLEILRLLQKIYSKR